MGAPRSTSAAQRRGGGVAGGVGGLSPRDWRVARSATHSVEEHDIFGDGVNVAARLEALAEPGGICVTGMVHDHIRDKLGYPFDDMGEQSVKNIARPLRV